MAFQMGLQVTSLFLAALAALAAYGSHGTDFAGFFLMLALVFLGVFVVAFVRQAASDEPRPPPV